MYISSPEVSALAQSLQPTLPIFQALDGHQEIQSAMAVLEAEESFTFNDNHAKWMDNGTPLELPDEKHRVKYLGFFLNREMDSELPLKVALKLPSSLAYHPFHLLLRSFSLTGTRQIKITHGITLQSEAEVNNAGSLKFEFTPLAELLKNPSKITGFHVYLVKPPTEQPISPPIQSESSTIEQEPGIVRAAPKLNVYKKVDTRA